eukprot:jgi/Botrbrau1/14533/Bobra.0235s0005.1
MHCEIRKPAHLPHQDVSKGHTTCKTRPTTTTTRPPTTKGPKQVPDRLPGTTSMPPASTTKMKIKYYKRYRQCKQQLLLQRGNRASRDSGR